MVNGLKVIETFGSDQFTRFGTINAKFFIKKTNETDENTYHLVDTIGEIYNLPAEPNEFILEDILGNTYLSTNGSELIINSKKLKPLADVNDLKADVDAGNLNEQNVFDWREKLRVPSLPDPGNDHQELIYIPIESDAWRNIPLTSTNPQWVQITAPFASTLNLVPNAAGREFAGVNTKFRKNGWDGKNIFLRNDSEFDLVLKPTATTAANTTFYTFEDEQVLKAHAWKLFKIREFGGDFFLVEVVLGKDINPDLFMLIADFVQDGKIRADKIESLALLDLIISVQTSIADFAANSGGYTFQKNDLIAVPDGSGKYSFYIYAGGVKTDVASYLAMGISNVTISQVVGLQDALTLISDRITANETAIATKQDKSMFSAIQDKWIHYYDLATAKFQPILKFVSGVVNQLEFSGRIKADAIVLPNNTNPVVANRLRSDGTDLFHSDENSVEKKILKSPTLISDYNNYPNIVAVNSSGHEAKVPFSSIGTDFVNSIFRKNMAYFIANPNVTTYATFRASGANGAVGAVASGNASFYYMNYTSSGSTIAQCRGRQLWIQSSRIKYVRKFAIASSVTTQRIFVGLSNSYGTAAVTNIPFSSQVSLCGICMESGSDKLWVVYNGSSGSAILLDTGFTNDTTSEYILTIQKSSTSGYDLTLEKFNAGNLTGIYTINLPSYFGSFACLFAMDELNTSSVTVRDWGAYLEQN